MEFNAVLKTLALLLVALAIASAMPHGGEDGNGHTNDHHGIDHEHDSHVPASATLVRKSRQYYGGYPGGYGGYGGPGFGGSSSNAFAAANSGSYGGGFGYPGGFGGSSSNAVAAAGSNSFGKK